MGQGLSVVGQGVVQVWWRSSVLVLRLVLARQASSPCLEGGWGRWREGGEGREGGVGERRAALAAFEPTALTVAAPSPVRAAFCLKLLQDTNTKSPYTNTLSAAYILVA